MRNTHCCQCGAVRKPTHAPIASFRCDEILEIRKYRPINSHPAPGVHNEESPQLIAQFSLYRNGGSDQGTHICDDCFVVGLKFLRERIESDLRALERDISPLYQGDAR